MFDKGRLLESEMNGMAIFVLPDEDCLKEVTLINEAEAAYEIWMSEAEEVGDTAICDWIIDYLERSDFKYGRDYRLFTDLYWD